ncbi:hypothetical protein PR048_008149 [Dryococelus australis]|uniref:Uncharacterized protein n=1 Tax=Dryococelus australis TaxID=614101 RepID=A0ABQ9HWA4_9NEOP|nr:hypothetical protein PR048_008149 [Dryococelus australis]
MEIKSVTAVVHGRLSMLVRSVREWNVLREELVSVRGVGKFRKGLEKELVGRVERARHRALRSRCSGFPRSARTKAKPVGESSVSIAVCVGAVQLVGIRRACPWTIGTCWVKTTQKLAAGNVTRGVKRAKRRADSSCTQVLFTRGRACGSLLLATLCPRSQFRAAYR